MYSSCGLPTSARKVFDEIPNRYKDTVDWTNMMSCYTHNNNPIESLRLFCIMQREGTVLRPDGVTFVCVFNGCARVGDCMFGSQGYVFMVKLGYPLSVRVGNAVMDMYVKCGRMGDAKRVFNEMGERNVVSWTVMVDGVIKMEGVGKGRVLFDEMPERNEITWTVMITGYIENGYSREAFLLLEGLGLCLNYVSLCSFLSACSLSGDLVMGKWVHVYALKTMEKYIHLMVGTSLLDMYSKCGRIDMASKVFRTMKYKNVVTWNAMLGGLAMHGRGVAVLDLFEEMVRETNPDDLTFVSVLSACSHSGLVVKGRKFFRDIGMIYGLTPKIEHYACMVDMLCRSGQLDEAEVLVKTMPISPNEVLLGSLLAACGVHGKLHFVEQVLQDLIQIDPLNTECHVLLSNMYTLAGRQDKAYSLREVLKNRGIRKVPGTSSIHVDGQAHHFSAGDKSHSRTKDVYIILEEMIQQLQLAGYVADTAKPSIFCF
ncbi:hypothetical protein GIB67_007299 [Kingdonia uniflora]|uniref:Pentatricopeptide repeat-containing protein n=1 Tax=Kingdonia uniflora TaxID=39325 RepID=A0A7J7NXZ0_9MAGN|nr:hypothetical protein GIB67_007299 [Kingdonia uniflora]